MKRKDHIFKTADGDFHFIDWGGEGDLAHFSHGTGLNAAAYSPLIEKLRSKFKILGMDNRGHGKTKAEADPSKLKSWKTFVSDLERFVESLNKPIVAMGHSLGGTVSLMLAAKRPELVKALILIDPIILPFSWMCPWRLAKKMGIAKFIPMAYQAARRKRIWPNKETLLKAYRSKPVFRSWRPEFLEEYINHGVEEIDKSKIQLSCDPKWEANTFAAYDYDVWRHVPKIKTNVLCIYGANSNVCMSSTVERFKSKVPESVFERLENTGHFVPMERPDETASIIMSFLEDVKVVQV